MSSPTRRTLGIQRGPRSGRVVAAVFEATLTALERDGYAGLSMDAVAAAAGVHKTTLYRRWPNKQALVAALIEPGLDTLRAVPTSGDPRSDLDAVALRLAANLAAREGRALAVGLAGAEPELRALVASAHDQAVATLRAAIARTGVAPDELDDRTHLLFHGVVHRALEGDGQRPDVAAGVVRLVRLVVP